ncbi:MAG: T9SS type A sorting domain-containing protein [Saprospiraceae bacterium]|nr:MAG: T9SS type A sorting domain-containing protein [Saprospiraceae bacterium]
MAKHYCVTRYTSTGLTGGIGSDDFNPDNRWIQTSGKVVHEGTEQYIEMSPHYSKPFAPPTLPPNIETPNAPGADWFVLGEADESETCPPALDCDFGNLAARLDEADVSIAKQDWDSETVFQPTLQWRAERYLLAKLESNPELIDDDSLVQVFYSNMRESTVALFNEIERKIELLDTVAASQTGQYRSNLDTIFSRQLEIAVLDSLLFDADSLESPALEAEKFELVDEVAGLMLENDSLFALVLASRATAVQPLLTLNNSISTTEIFEENEKTANDIWLRTVALGIDTLTQEQFDLLDTIVWQCPLMGGNAVYKARTLYLMEVDTVFYDEDTCEELEERSAFKNSPEARRTFRLYPNPASQSVTLTLEKSNSIPFSLVITNIYGEPVFQAKITAGQSQFTFPVRDIPSGFYFCRVYQDEEEAFSRR